MFASRMDFSWLIVPFSSNWKKLGAILKTSWSQDEECRLEVACCWKNEATRQGPNDHKSIEEAGRRFFLTTCWIGCVRLVSDGLGLNGSSSKWRRSIRNWPSKNQKWRLGRNWEASFNVMIGKTDEDCKQDTEKGVTKNNSTKRVNQFTYGI